MAFKRNFKKRNFRRRKVRKFPKPKASTMIEKGLNLARLVSSSAYAGKVIYGLYSAINSEKLYHDTTFLAASPQLISTTGFVQPLSNTTQSDLQTGRTGQSILAQDILIRYSIQMNATAVSTVVRLILLCDKEMDGTYPAITEILASTTPQSPLDIDDSKGRFVILFDRLIQMNITTNVGSSQKVYKKLGFHIYSRGTDNSEGSQGKNSLFLIGLSNEATLTPSMIMHCRLKYTDN